MNVNRPLMAMLRFQRKAKADGFEEISENGHPLGQLRRGGRTKERIVEARIDPMGYAVWVKIQ